VSLLATAARGRDGFPAFALLVRFLGSAVEAARRGASSIDGASATTVGGISSAGVSPLAGAAADGVPAFASLAGFFASDSDAPGRGASGMDGAEAIGRGFSGIDGPEVTAVIGLSLVAALSLALGSEDCCHCNRKPIPAAARMSAVRT
jgi:hypothetical protein